MKIAIIPTSETVKEFFSDKQLQQLSSMGELVFNDGDNSIEQVKKTIRDAEIAITTWGTSKLTAEILDCAPKLRLIAHAAGSVRSIVSDVLWQRDIVVINSSNILGIGVAETTLGLTIACCKNFFQLNFESHMGSYFRHDVKELSNIIIGVIGAGWSGRHYIKLLQMFEVEILVFDPYMTESDAKTLNVKKTSLESLLENSDIVSIHAPSIPETNNMICAKTLGLMKKDSILINTARGSLVNEQDLYEHMKAGFLKYACLDVFKNLSNPSVNALRSLPNVIITPHIAGIVNNGKCRLIENVINEIDRFMHGKKLDCEVTKQIMERMT